MGSAGSQSWGYTCYLWLIERQRYLMMHAQYPLPVYYSQVWLTWNHWHHPLKNMKPLSTIWKHSTSTSHVHVPQSLLVGLFEHRQNSRCPISQCLGRCPAFPTSHSKQVGLECGCAEASLSTSLSSPYALASVPVINGLLSFGDIIWNWLIKKVDHDRLIIFIVARRRKRVHLVRRARFYLPVF